MVRMKIGGQTVDFMVDTGAEHSVKVAPLSGKEVTIIGATGDQTRRPFCDPRQCQLGGHQVINEFLYLPDCPVPLMLRDLLAKMGAEITFAPDGSAQLRLGEETSPMILSLANLNKEKEFLLVWAEGNPPGLAKDHAPVLIELKLGTQPVKIRQYPTPRQARLGIQVHSDRLLQWGLVKRYRSPWNTPLLPVKKPGTNDYCPVHDLRAVNEAVITLHSALPNPYTLLGLIPSEAEWFTCLDLKDAFFCLQLAPSSQPLFTFEWENPTTGAKEQFTWTRLPQGFKNSPTLFSGALASDLSKFPGQDLGCVLLQYVDDLLLGSSTRAQCWEGTRALLRLLTETGYRVSKKKAQVCQKEVKYLGFQITQGKRRLGTERKQAHPVADSGIPGSGRVLSIWIPGFSDLAKPLYEALREEKAPIEWGPEQEKAFITIKAKLTEAPALGLPDVMRDFNLFVHENSRVALGVLTHETKLKCKSTSCCCHPDGSKGAALADSCLNDSVSRARESAADGAPEHDCLEVLEEVYSSRPDLRDRPLQNADLVLFTDGSSFLDEGKRRARYAVVSNFETIAAQVLPEGWSAQRAELWALVRALECSKNKRANIYTDSRYAFATLHVHGAIYKKRGLLTAGGKGIKNQNEILKLLEAVWKPKEIADIYCNEVIEHEVTRKGKTQYQKETSVLTPQPSWLLKNK
ncbi:LOW QUALITY PROTEIN: hypothetical protein QTO34_000660 [Cnephaeus nilssonii]|uniref:Uncharacterized protein n=1 Tax=Cnephaeus nilssonii TaxID=3371016 RepID=A0AA40LUV3_CNENI|nr:LOW QUALITY PROTEIN: hypothetical protein QTO34_000660 [Eptesicus nilssonii]